MYINTDNQNEHESFYSKSFDRQHFNAYLAIEVSFNISAEKMHWPDSIKELVASMNLCESSTLEFLQKQFQNDFESLRLPKMMIPEPPPAPPVLTLSPTNVQSYEMPMPVFLPPPKINTFMLRKSLKAKIINFLKARENDFLFTLMFRRC